MRQNIAVYGVGLVGLLICVAVCAEDAHARDYEIRLHRPVKPGYKYRQSSVGNRLEWTRIKYDGKLAEEKKDELSIRFEAEVTVLATNDKGGPSRSSLKIVKCVAIKGKDEKELVPRDTVVLAYVKDKKDVFEIAVVPVSNGTFEVGGVPVDRELHKALSTVFTLSKGGITDDDVFGTKQRKKVGDSWDIDTRRAVEGLESRAMTIPKKHAKGKVTLDKVVRVEGMECLNVVGTINISNVVFPVPSGFKIEKGVAEILFSHFLF